MRFYWMYPARTFARERTQSLLAVLCIAIGVMAFVALQLAGAMVNTSLTGDIRALNGGDLDMSYPRLPAAQLAYFAQLQAQGQISAYTAVVSDNGSAVGAHPLARIDRIQAVDPARFPLAGAPVFAEPGPRSLASALTGSSAVLTADLAHQLGVHTGDSITLTLADGNPAQFHIGGVIRNAGLFQEPQILIAFTTYLGLRRANAPPLSYYNVYVNTPGDRATDIAALARQVQAQFPQGVTITAAGLLASNQQEANSIQSFLRVIALVALLIGGLGVANTLRALLRRRAGEIAILKTLGYTQPQLYLLFAVEALLYGLAGGAMGALAGIGASMALRDAIASAFTLTLTPAIDPLTVVEGVAVGGATALIFGLAPIARASQIRPIAILRGLPEGARAASWVMEALLLAPLGLLFYALAFTILGDPLLALAVTGGAGVVTGLLALILTPLNALASRAPVLGLGPRVWREQIKLALRNLGRQRGRVVTTQIASFTGVFAIGVILVLGQGLHAQYSQPSNAIDAFVGVTTTAFAPTVEAQLHQSAGVTRIESYPTAGVQIIAHNGAPLQNSGSGSGLGKIEGYNLAHGQVPTPPDITLESGRLLTSADAGTTNVDVNRGEFDRSLNLALGDTLTVQFTTKFNGTPAGAATATLTVVGFVTNTTLFSSYGGDILADSSIATRLAGDHTQVDILLHVDPSRANTLLSGIVEMYPSQVWVHNLGDVAAEEGAFFNSVILALEAIVLPALLAALLIAANTVALALLERRREIGILKAVGYTSRSALAGIVIEQGVAGLIAALLASVAIPAVAFAALGLVVGGKSASSVSVSASAGLMVALVAISVTVLMLVAAFVAWSATRVRPLEVLRYE
jgi:predicted lysophospholipase L1 biosynthesis ABC-type transport system permease subunit